MTPHGYRHDPVNIYSGKTDIGAGCDWGSGDGCGTAFPAGSGGLSNEPGRAGLRTVVAAREGIEAIDITIRYKGSAHTGAMSRQKPGNGSNSRKTEEVYG